MGDPSGEVHAEAAPPAQADAYDRVLRDLPALVARATEAGSTILVVSKGDDRLLRIEDRTGWHFPRAADGRYAGYHPADSEEAVAHLERLRRQGADYIVFPQTSLWWLDHYSALRRYLEGRYDVARRDAAGAVFDVRRPRTAAEDRSALQGSPQADDTDPPGAAAQAADREPVRPVASVVEGLLPKDAKLLVTTAQPHALAGLPPDRTAAIAPEEDATRVLAAVQVHATAGSQFLVVPRDTLAWLADRPSLASELRARYPLVTRQEHFCEIYDLRLDAPQAEPTTPGK